MNAISPEDEFLIQATGPNLHNRSWTRSTYDVAKHIADQSVFKLGYTRAEVRNTFGGHISDVLYEVTATHSRDVVAEERQQH